MRQTFEVDAARSSVTFTLESRSGMVSGKLGEVGGTLELDGEDVTGGCAALWVDVQGLDTTGSGSPTPESGMLEHALRGRDLLHSDFHPRVTWRSTGAVAAGEGTFEVRGALTLRAVTREVPFTVRLLGRNKEARGGERVRLAATARLRPEDFGLATQPESRELLGDAVSVQCVVYAFTSGAPHDVRP